MFRRLLVSAALFIVTGIVMFFITFYISMATWPPTTIASGFRGHMPVSHMLLAFFLAFIVAVLASLGVYSKMDDSRKRKMVTHRHYAFRYR
ncbi:hypothetical protein LX64_03580 [Chitinophaga skermanii]|uniref:Uncharacterized protein n=1 Tax=Chitinophaga skermanii TaxID=331697 RepID=A0A327QDK6_9BACT|nr:hypothetical protein [Chitinophaga skermanii]RAJ02560.1 hypothetical protein LX64_03580 [Chitinophaga skermanii]